MKYFKLALLFYFLARAAGNGVLYKMLLVVKYISQLLSKRRRGFTLQRNIILECKQIVFSVMSKYISQLAAAREEAVSPNATHSPPFLLQFFLSSNNVGFRGSKTAGLNKDHFAPFLGGRAFLSGLL